MAMRRLGDDGRGARFNGSVNFLMPDGAPFRARCDAHFTHDRWRGVLTISLFDRGLEQGDVCKMSCERLGELRIIILDKVGTNRYDFIALVHPDPLEVL
jgi:hypothetical protein